MEITINKAKIELKFGVKFLRELDKTTSMEVENNKFGMGIMLALPKLEMFDPVTLSDVIYAASYAAKKRPSRDDVDEYIDGAEDLETIFKEVRELIESSNAIKLVSKSLGDLSKNLRA